MPKPASIISEQYFRDRSQENENGCWEWILSLNQNGYSCAKVSGNHWSGHRLSWTYFYGKIPEGMNVCHKCDNRKCVNPDHLFIGTTQDNVDDKMKKGRFVPVVGEKNVSSKLKFSDVEKIVNDKRPQRLIAKDYGISQSNVSIIKSGKAWRIAYHNGATI